MSTTRDPAPTGQLTLVDYFCESSSGHVDNSRTVTLGPGKSFELVLTENKDSNNQFRGPSSESTFRWSIDRKLLIEFIKTNGTLPERKRAMSKLTEEQMAKGQKRFLDANPDVARKIAALTDK